MAFLLTAPSELDSSLTKLDLNPGMDRSACFPSECASRATDSIRLSESPFVFVPSLNFEAILVRIPFSIWEKTSPPRPVNLTKDLTRA